MNTTEVGNRGEDTACLFLVEQGFKIVERNWKTKRCEIDIIAQKKNRIYFVEVKTRHNAVYGGGLGSISTQKLRQMSFAAELWVQANNWTGPYQLSVIAIDSNDVLFIEDL